MCTIKLLLLYSIPLFNKLTSKLSKFNADRWSLMIDSSFLTRVSSLFPAPVDIAAVRCSLMKVPVDIRLRTSNVRIKLVSTCRRPTSTRRFMKAHRFWMNEFFNQRLHSLHKYTENSCRVSFPRILNDSGVPRATASI